MQLQAVRSVASGSKFYQLLPDEENTAVALYFYIRNSKLKDQAENDSVL